MGGRIVVTYDPKNPESARENLMRIIETAFDSVIGPHIADACRGLAPIGKAKNFNPRLKKSKSYQPVDLRESVAPGRGIGPKIERLRQLRENEVEVDVAKDAEFFVGRSGPNAGKTPDKIAFRRGGVVGAFAHQPGTLRKSIKYVGAQRVGNTVVGTVEATAEYAAAVNNGYTVHSHGKATARTVPGRHFMEEGLELGTTDLGNASSYKAG